MEKEMENRELLEEYEKMMKDFGNPIQSESENNGGFKIFTLYNDSKYETHTYCNISNIKS